MNYIWLLAFQVLKFNGTPVKNLRQLAEMAMSCTEQYMRFDLEYNEVVVIESRLAQTSTSEVMTSHSVAFAMSSDMRSALPSWPVQAGLTA